MSDIKEKTQALVRAIQESKEYKEFCALKEKVNADPELHREINDFRLHVFEVQNSQEPLDMYAEEESLCNEYEEFRKKPMVNEFLRSELRVCRILQKVTADIADAVDLDTDEFAGRIDV